MSESDRTVTPDGVKALAERTLLRIESIDGWQGKEFLHSVHGRLTSIVQWIERNSRATPGQRRAVVNMARGVDGWVVDPVESVQ